MNTKTRKILGFTCWVIAWAILPAALAIFGAPWAAFGYVLSSTVVALMFLGHWFFNISGD